MTKDDRSISIGVRKALVEELRSMRVDMQMLKNEVDMVYHIGKYSLKSRIGRVNTGQMCVTDLPVANGINQWGM